MDVASCGIAKTASPVGITAYKHIEVQYIWCLNYKNTRLHFRGIAEF